MEREEIERAADSLLALSHADKRDREQIAVAVARRLLDIPDLESRITRSHALVRLGLVFVRRVSRVRHLAVVEWGRSHGEVAGLIGESRSTAQTIARRGGARLPWEG